MAAFDRPGRFKARIIDLALGETKDSHIPSLSIQFAATEYMDNGNWIDWTEYSQEIYGYFHPFKKDGTVNETTVNNLKTALGWDGSSLGSLQDDTFIGKTVQIQVKEENYNGQTKLKVAWLDHEDYVPGLRKLEDKEVKAMGSAWDAKLRAVNGGKTTPAKKPTAAAR